MLNATTIPAKVFDEALNFWASLGFIKHSNQKAPIIYVVMEVNNEQGK